jgi:hypothetical protein
MRQGTENIPQGFSPVFEDRHVILEKWLGALRNPATQQIKGYLKTTKGWDVLGVLCEVAGLTSEGWGGADNGDVVFRFLSDTGAVRHSVPTDLRRHMRLRTDNGIFSHHQIAYGQKWFSLSEMNDHGIPFPQLADFIEKNTAVIFQDDF